ncbi:MAG TPA: cobalamin-binding protein [Thermodesulfobacteriota bacterium]
MRIVSLLPSATEILFLLGLGDQVVGVSHECDYPAEAASRPALVRPAVDPTLPSAELDRQVSARLATGQGLYVLDEARLADLAPDLVVTQALCDVCAVRHDEVLEASARLPSRPTVVSLLPSNLADVMGDIRRVAEATGRVQAAERVVAGLEARIDAVRQRVAGADRPVTAAIEWLDPIMIGGHWVPEQVAIAGGTDPLGRVGAPSAKVEWQAVVDARPEVLVLMPCGFDRERTTREAAAISSRPGFADLPAVRAGRVFAVNGHAYFNRPGPRLIDGIELLAHLLHPERVPWPAGLPASAGGPLAVRSGS